MRRRRGTGWINAHVQLNNSTAEASLHIFVLFIPVFDSFYLCTLPFEYDLTPCSLCFTRTFLGYATLIRAYVDFLHAKLRYHSNHPEFNGTFDYNEYISLKGIDDPNEGYVLSFIHDHKKMGRVKINMCLALNTSNLFSVRFPVCIPLQ